MNSAAPDRLPGSADDADLVLYDPRLITGAAILVVDDEPLITTTLKHFFSLELEHENVTTFNSSRDAAAWAEQNPVDLVISDFLMPVMDGLALLAHVKRVRPEATRILLTGYADKANAIRAINEVGLFQYVEKPWDNARLAAAVRSGLEHMAMRKTLRALIAQLGTEHAARDKMARALLRAFT